VIRFLLIAILFLLIARMFWRVIDGVIEGAGGGSSRRKRPLRSSVKLVKDPVCGTWVAPRPELAENHGGETHYFCSEKCRRAFRP